MRPLALAFVLALALAAACSNGTDSQSCNPGDQVDCTCSTTKGVQTCNSDGTGYDLCSCANTGTGGRQGGTGAAGTSSTPSCIPYGSSCDASIPCCSSMGCSIYNQCQP